MRLTIVTDISCSTQTLNNAYAFYIGCRKGKIMKAGELKIKTKNVDVAELQCIGNALFTFLKTPFEGITSITVYTDSINCMCRILGLMARYDNKEFNKSLDLVLALNERICKKHNLKVNYQHIKAHTQETHKLARINDWCDKEAVKYRKRMDLRKPKKR